MTEVSGEQSGSRPGRFAMGGLGERAQSPWER